MNRCYRRPAAAASTHEIAHLRSPGHQGVRFATCPASLVLRSLVDVLRDIARRQGASPPGSGSRAERVSAAMAIGFAKGLVMSDFNPTRRKVLQAGVAGGAAAAAPFLPAEAEGA